MSEEKNFLKQVFEKPRKIEESVNPFLRLRKIEEKIDKLVLKEQDLSAIIARLDIIDKRLVELGQKVDLTKEEEETLNMLKKEILTKK